MPRDPIHALLVENDAELRAALVDYLGRYEMRVTALADAPAVRDVLRARPFDVLLLDLMLPQTDGLALCRRVRARSRLPIIALTDESDRGRGVAGLEQGADDFLAKPFVPRELVARIDALMRRTHPDDATGAAEPAQPVAFLHWRLDPAQRRLVAPGGTSADLTALEFDLLCAFMARSGQLLSRERLVHLVRPQGAPRGGGGGEHGGG
jgi:two-component system OmpR family response regulator